MESTLAFLDGNPEFLAEDGHAAVVRHLEVIDASHDTGKIIVRRIRGLARLADNCEHRSEVLEA
jgi:hypothetical protein